MNNRRNYRLLTAMLSVAFVILAKAQDPLPVPVMPLSNFAPPATPDSTLTEGGAGSQFSTFDSLPSTIPWEEQIRMRLDNFAAEANRAPYTAGICVFDLTDDVPVWNYNAQKVMRPASTQKVLTAITALSVLGSKHEFKTRSYYTGTIAADGTLSGDRIRKTAVPAKQTMTITVRIILSFFIFITPEITEPQQHLIKNGGVQLIINVLSVSAVADEIGVFEHIQMLGNGGHAHFKIFRYLSCG